MAITAGGNLNAVPAPIQQAAASNYLDFNQDMGWAQQYLPDLMEKEAEVFGPRTISGFLEKIGAEEAMTSDQVVWSEQGRLHLSYKGNMSSNNIFSSETDIDGNAITTTHGIRLNDTVLISNANGIFKAVVTSITGAACTVAPYDGVQIDQLTTTTATTLLVYGSEFGKGTGYYNNSAASTTLETRGANEPSFKTFANKPIIMKDFYEINGSDVSRIGWVEVTGEEGQSGYLWYLKAEADTRARFTDYLEMSMIEGVIGSDAAHNYGAGKATTGANAADAFIGSNGDVVGTEGLFAAVEDRGNLTSGVTGSNAATDLAEFDAILAEFDKQGACLLYTSPSPRD